MGDASRAWGPSTARRFVRRGTDVSSAPLAVRVSHTLSGRLRLDDDPALKAREQPDEDLWDWEDVRGADTPCGVFGPACHPQGDCPGAGPGVSSTAGLRLSGVTHAGVSKCGQPARKSLAQLAGLIAEPPV